MNYCTNTFFRLLSRHSLLNIDIMKNILRHRLYDYVKNFIEKYLIKFSKKIEYIINNANKSSKKSSFFFDKLKAYFCVVNKNNTIEILNKDRNVIVKVKYIYNLNEELFINIVNSVLLDNIVYSIIPLLLLKNIIYINIPSNLYINIPIHFFNHLYDKNSLSSNYLFINIGEGSSVKIYQTNYSNNESINSNIVNVLLNKNASLEYTNMQNEYYKSYSFFNFFVNQKKNSSIYFNNISLGGNFLFNCLNIFFVFLNGFIILIVSSLVL